jgi:RNA polymerase sigma-70 factor (ECF subfamily)
MELQPADSPLERLLADRFEAERRSQPSSIETEVTQLFDELREPLHRYLSSFGLSLQDVEEIVQEVFLSLFLHLRDKKPRSNIRGWTFRVAHNLGLKRREKNQRTLRLVVGSEECLLESQLDAAPNPEEQVSSAQKRRRLLAVVNALSDQDRRCLYLRAEGLRYREIAEVLGISLGGVASSLARSLERLIRADASD